jgi:hypothetical protein
MGREDADKPGLFREEARALGWKADLRRTGDKSTVIATRGSEKLSISWRGDACLNETMYEDGSSKRKLRNAAAARRQLTISSNGKVVKATKSSGNSSKRVKAEVPEPDEDLLDEVPEIKRHLPFDIDTATDDEILKAVVGMRIVWRNSYSHGFDEARVLAHPNQRHLRIEFNRRQERCITFAAADEKNPRIPGGGFRSVKLSSITSITPK